LLRRSSARQDICAWVPEGSLAGFPVRHDMALESGCGADFFVEIVVPGGPRRSRVPGVHFGRKSRENRAENLQPDCLQVPRSQNRTPWPSEGTSGASCRPSVCAGSLCGGSAGPLMGRSRAAVTGPPQGVRCAGRPRNPLNWVPEGNLAGDFRPGSPGISGRNSPPGTLDRRSPPRTSMSTKNQPRRPSLRPCRGTPQKHVRLLSIA